MKDLLRSSPIIISVLHFIYKDSSKCKTIQIWMFNVISEISDTCRKAWRKIITNVYERSIQMIGDVFPVCMARAIIQQFCDGWWDTTLFPIDEYTD